MTAKAVDDDMDRVLGRLTRKFVDLTRRVRDGSMPAEQVLGGMQAIIEGQIMGAERKLGKPKVQYVNTYFVSTERQVANIRRWNRRYDWGFTDEQIDEVAKDAPNWPQGQCNPLVAVVLVPYLGVLQRDFDGCGTIVAKRQESSWRNPDLKSDPDHLRLLDGVTYPGHCLRWEVIDLGANRKKAPGGIRNPQSPHIGILAAAAHHPRWVRAMNGDKVPYVWAPGLQSREGNGEWRFVPVLGFIQCFRQVILSHSWDGFDDPCYAVPSPRES